MEERGGREGGISLGFSLQENIFNWHGCHQPSFQAASEWQYLRSDRIPIEIQMSRLFCTMEAHLELLSDLRFGHQGERKQLRSRG